MIYLTGDTHGSIDIAKLNGLREKLSATDYLIILGDFGLLWYGRQNEFETKLLDFYNSFDCPVLWLDGNHENFNRVDELPTKCKYGGEVGVVSDNIYHLKRGEIYNIEGKTFFVMGGAASVDRHLRTPYISWWPREIPSKQEFDHAFDKLESVNYNVDYILTHDAPLSVCECLYKYIRVYDKSVIQFLEEVKQRTTYTCWYFGHHHIDKVISEKMIAVYDSIHTIQ